MDSTENFEMSKLLITGPVHPSFPYIVLQELALECGCLISIEEIKTNPSYYAKIFKKISKLKPRKFDDLSQPKDFENACFVVNPCVSWSKDRDNLWASLMFLKGFQGLFQEDNMRRVYTFQKFGLQNPYHKFSYNACILFTLARLRDIDVHLEIEYEELFYKIAQTPVPSLILDHSEDEPDVIPLSTNDGPEVISHQIIEQTPFQISIDSLPSDTKVIVSVSIKDPSRNTFDFSKEFQNIQTIGEMFDDIEYIRKHFHPQNNEQALVAGALNHHKDLSLCANPLLEYKAFTTDEYEYEPIDSSLKFLMEKNPNYSDLWVYFNPYLPKSLYRNSTLKHHIRLFYSYDIIDYMDREIYEMLQELHLQENFHLGWLPTIHNDETPISLEPVDKLMSQEIICYGVRDEKLTAMTWDELAELFENTKLFVDPTQKKSLFDISKIERLIRLAKWILDPNHEHRYLFFYYKDSTRLAIQRCLNICENLILFHKEEFKDLQKYVTQFNEKLASEQIGIRECMERLFESIMYMRGWKGPSKQEEGNGGGGNGEGGNGEETHLYPIEIVPFCDPNTTEERTFESLSRLDAWNEASENFIYQLPLVLWKNEFCLSHDEEQGLTIGDRIKIIQSTEGINSCIRMSSNVLGASYCFYCRLFGLKERFDIRNLHSII